MTVVGRTSKGIALIRIAKIDEELESTVPGMFPNYKIVEAAENLQDEIMMIDQLVENPRIKLDISIDLLFGTEFQRVVWHVVRHIRPGSTKTYAEVAKEIGKPKAIRAVARSCTVNPLMIVVPCHRVIRSNGDLSGCEWGNMKSILLEREKTN